MSVDLFDSLSLCTSARPPSNHGISSSFLLMRIIYSVYIQRCGIFLEEVTKASWMNSVFERGGGIASERHLQ